MGSLSEGSAPDARWDEYERWNHECRLPPESWPPGQRVTINVAPLDSVDEGLALLDQTCPVVVAGEVQAVATVVEFKQWGWDEQETALTVCLRSTRVVDAEVTWPRRCPDGILAMQKQRLAGIEVDRRPTLYVARDPQRRGPVDQDGVQSWFEAVNVDKLPAPWRLDAPPCMTRPRGLIERRYRQVFPKSLDSCCDFHRVDWRAACQAAVDLIDQAYDATDGDSQEVAAWVAARIRADHALSSQLDFTRAVRSLVSTVAIFPSRDGERPDYVNGQHRAVVLFDQGVRRTVIKRQEIAQKVEL